MQHRGPYLKETDGCEQLYVNGRPFLILGAELQNSSMSSAEYMKPIWPKLAKDNINTVLGSVTWEQIESVEGQFNFSELDQIIADARSHGLHLILLWFGSFKNGLSTYAPAWVKQNPKRFPRVVLRKAGGHEETADILSLFGGELPDVETRAFTKLIQHIKSIDEGHSTVIMIQVENEVGILGDSRDASAHANNCFAGAVPHELLGNLHREWNGLYFSLQQTLAHFKNSSSLSQGPSWEEVFGSGPKVDELFMAYHYAIYVNRIALAGKSVHDIPMYTNVWQNYGTEDRETSLSIIVSGGSEPGVYPSGGGVVNVLDIWQMFAPDLDFIAPDIYLNEYGSTCAKYRHYNQALFIPEQRRDEHGARRIWKAFGDYRAIGTSPFGIDTVEVEHGHNPFRRHYGLLSQVQYHVLAAHRRQGSSIGFYFDELSADASSADPSEAITKNLGEWELTVERSFVFGRPSPGSGMVIHLQDARFLLIGWGFQVAFKSLNPKAHFSGILSVKEKEVVDKTTGDMRTVRLLNGDETKSGKFVIMPSKDPDYGGFPISITIPARTGIAEVEVYDLVDDD